VRTARLLVPVVVAAALVTVPATIASSDAQQSATPGPSTVPAAVGRATVPSVHDGVSAAVPVVAFPREVVVRDGRLRTPVLLADPTVTATARVIGATGPGCSVELRQGVPGWLDCAVPRPAEPRIVVVLSDGRRVARAVDRVVVRTHGAFRANIA
jgi:hypothetical protein